MKLLSEGLSRLFISSNFCGLCCIISALIAARRRSSGRQPGPSTGRLLPRLFQKPVLFVPKIQSRAGRIHNSISHQYFTHYSH